MAEEDDPRSQEDENVEEPEQDSGDGNGNDRHLLSRLER